MIHNRIQEYGLEEVSKTHRDDRFHIKKHLVNDESPTKSNEEDAKTPPGRRQHAGLVRGAANSIHTHLNLDEEDKGMFQLRVQLAMLKGQYNEKKEIVDSQGGKEKNQEEYSFAGGH
mgnify:CR=1 FL=1